MLPRNDANLTGACYQRCSGVWVRCSSRASGGAAAALASVGVTCSAHGAAERSGLAEVGVVVMTVSFLLNRAFCPVREKVARLGCRHNAAAARVR